MNRREAFSKWVPRTFTLDTAFDDEGDVYYEDEWVQGAWIGWNAALDSVEIELPEINDSSPDPLYACAYAQKVREVIEQAGLKVKK